MYGRLHLWGESSPRHKFLRKSRADLVTRSPFDIDRRSLAQTLILIAGGHAAARAAHARPGYAWLPSSAGRPHPSQGVLLPTDRLWPDADAPTLQPWRITMLPLSWMEQCALLASCSSGPRIGPKVMAGRDLMAWSLLWRFAGAMVARQSYLPDLLEVAPKCFESRWTPVLDGAENPRLEPILRRLPPCVGCLTTRPDRPPDRIASREARHALGREYVADALDRLVRTGATTPLTRAHALKGLYSGAHAAWMASLRGDGRRIRWKNPEDLRALARDLTRWRRPLSLGSDSGVRLLLRLTEPLSRAGQGPWRLRCLLHRAHRNSPPQPVFPMRTLPRKHREYALTALGQAASLCPSIREDRYSEKDACMVLDVEEAYTFLTVHAPLLTSSGFDVDLPEWWTRQQQAPPLQLVAKLDPPAMQPEASENVGLDALVQVNWSLAQGDRTVTPRELDALLTASGPLVRLRRDWIEVDRKRLTELRHLLQERDRIPLRELMRMFVGAVKPAGLKVRVAGDSDSRPVNALLQTLEGEARLEPLPTPSTFNGILRPYQQRGFAWSAYLCRWGLGACLADDMGLGKTIQTLALLAYLREQGEQRPVLLLCPMSLIGNWLREAQRFTPTLAVLSHHGPGRVSGEILADAVSDQALAITSYSTLLRDFSTLSRIHWAGIVIDEAQNIKNPATRQSRAVRALNGDFRLALTGTPVENQMGDLWALMDFLNAGLLGSRADFQNRFQRPIRTGIDRGARAALRRLTAPFILRRLKTDPSVITDLPKRIESKVYCTLTREQASLYAAELRALDERLDALSGRERRGLVLATLTRLKQICNHPQQFLGGTDDLRGRSGKLDRIAAMVREILESDEKALIFTQYATMGRLLCAYLREHLDTEIPFLHGGVPRAAREAMVARFQAQEGPPLFVLSLKAGGTGLNLMRANHVFHYDRWWNPAVENQATDRAHRIGQHRTVFVYKLICAGTLEERIDAMIEDKQSLADDLIGAGDRWLTELSNQRLREVLALSLDMSQTENRGKP